MIQVCSRCGTRWNVRDQRRSWCPRCHGGLWAPLTADQEAELRRNPSGAVPPPAVQPAPGQPAPDQGQGQPNPPQVPQLPPGYRWIAVRPGPPPPPRIGHRPLGPTPHYTEIPRWSLGNGVPPAVPATGFRPPPSLPAVRGVIRLTAIALGAAAAAHALIYVLLIINRTMLLPPVIAGGAVWLSRLAALLAVVAVIRCAVVLTRWLIARRAATFARLGSAGLPESRSERALKAGCLVPGVNLLWAPVFAIELAGREGRLSRLRRPIVEWWLVWAGATGAAVFATATSRTTNAQGIGDNTMAFVIAYLAGLVALRMLARVVDAFEARSVHRSAHHWVVVAGERSDAVEPRDDTVETRHKEPAA